jgi:hypothetical protein
MIRPAHPHRSLSLRFDPLGVDFSIPNTPRRVPGSLCGKCIRGDHSGHGTLCCGETVAPPPRDYVCTCKEGISHSPPNK